MEDATASSVPTPLSSTSTDHRQHLLELGLLQYYINKVAPSVPHLDRELWRRIHGDYVTQEALRSTALLNAIFSYALLHMYFQLSVYGVLPRNTSFFEDVGIRMTATNSNDGKVDLLTAHRNYLDRALQEQRVVVMDINATNADSACLSAMILGMTMMVHDSLTDADHRTAQYNLPLQWFHGVRAYSACIGAARPHLNSDSAFHMLLHSKPTIDQPKFDPGEYSAFLHLLDWQPRTNRETMDNATLKTYQDTLVLIQSIHRRLEEGDPWQNLGRRIIAFPNLAPPDFVTFVEQRRPRALVMLAHFLALTKPLHSNWWIFYGAAEYHVKGIAQLVPAEWQWAMNWPLEMIEKEYQVDEKPDPATV